MTNVKLSAKLSSFAMPPTETRNSGPCSVHPLMVAGNGGRRIRATVLFALGLPSLTLQIW